ncbi:MAG TPA: hypothetical protein VK536_09720 [Candidatus Limnocylindrales bacterium]|nr:hypothetical protein [Candidatus Limnocylindrales bacterium]
MNKKEKEKVDKELREIYEANEPEVLRELVTDLDKEDLSDALRTCKTETLIDLFINTMSYEERKKCVETWNKDIEASEKSE